jgi:hypothetical protein
MKQSKTKNWWGCEEHVTKTRQLEDAACWIRLRIVRLLFHIKEVKINHV